MQLQFGRQLFGPEREHMQIYSNKWSSKAIFMVKSMDMKQSLKPPLLWIKTSDMTSMLDVIGLDYL